MTRLGVFTVVAFGAAVGSVSGALAVGKKKGGQRQQPYAAIGSGLIATGAAAVAYTAPTCPPCAAGTVANGAVTGPTSLSRGGYTAAVALASIIGAVAGGIAVGKQKSSKLLGQQPYAPIGAALFGAGAAAALYPTPPTCPPCVAVPPAVTTPAPPPAVTAPAPAPPQVAPPHVVATASTPGLR